jgi:glycosyltransferase involved in cell wall biosynthesis
MLERTVFDPQCQRTGAGPKENYFSDPTKACAVRNHLRIVLVMIDAPVPFGNPAARWFYVLLRGLVERGHQVTAFAACSKPQEMEQARTLFPSPAYDLRCYPFPTRSGFRAKLGTLRRPYSYMFGPDLQRDLEATLAQGFDILHLEQLSSAWLGLRWRERALVNVHFLPSIDLDGTASVGWDGRVQRWLMLRAERSLVPRLKHICALSPRLSEALRCENASAHLYTVPLGLDLALYPFIPDTCRTTQPVVSVIGNMRWLPSRSAAVRLLNRLWPEIRRQVPEAQVEITGWSARSALTEYLDLAGVSIAENVTDIRPCFERAGVLLYAPSRGSGMKVKVLEALALGVPVVTTSEGIEGIPAEDSVHAGVCDDDAGLIERTVNLLRDSSARDRLRAAGRLLVETHCGPRPTLDRIEGIYAAILDTECCHV